MPARVWLLFALLIGAAPAYAQSAAQRGLSQTELEALNDLPPAQREALLGTLIQSAENEQDEALAFPTLVEPLEEGAEGEEDLPPPQLFDELGEPILDSEAQPVFFTDELRKILGNTVA